MRSTAGGVLPRQSRVPPPDRRFNTAEPTYCQLIPAAPRSVIDSASTNEGWVLTPRHRAARTVRRGADSWPRDQDRFHHRTIEERWIPDPRRLPPVGSPVEPSAGPVHVSGLVRRPTSLHPLRVTASG